MAGPIDLDKLFTQFQSIADTSSEESPPQLINPGVEGLQVLLESVVDDNPVGVEAVRRVYKENGWADSESLTWSDVKSLVQSLGKDTKDVNDYTADAHADELGHMYEIIAKRECSKEFPLVKPFELQSKEEQEAAAMSLSLIDQMEQAKLESYIAEERLKVLKAECVRTGDSPTEENADSQKWKQQEAEWNYLHYYAVLRCFLAIESFHGKKFLHRCEGDRFLSLIPPQTIKDESKKQQAHSIISKVKSEFIPMIDVALWKAWSEIETLLQVTGEDASDVFLRFVTDDYINIIAKECDEAEGQKVAPFTPPFPPEAHASGGKKR